MQKVITIELNGNACQLDESGYNALRTYLSRADAQLRGDPDRAEIMRDLERSIAEKCQRVLGPGKTVVASHEIAQILAEIGPIDPAAGPSGPDAPGIAAPVAPRRLYQIREGAILGGLCNGLAAYFNLDPTIVRVGFVLAAVMEMNVSDRPPWMTVGTYLLLLFIVPYAQTSEERAAAQGTSGSLPTVYTTGSTG